MTELWRTVPGEPLYQASSLGRIRSFAKGGSGPPKILHGGTERGYLAHIIGGRRKYAHQLVALAFLGPRPDGMDVCHANGIRSDNRVENLRYDTRKGNMEDALRHGTTTAGERHGGALLTWAQVHEIREIYAAGGISQRLIGERFGVSRTTIQSIVEGRNWRDGADAIRKAVLGA